MDYIRIDRELDELGKVPGELRALIARNAGDDCSLAKVDAALSALQEGVSLPVVATPPQLQVSAATETAAAAAALQARRSEPAQAQRAALPWESDAPEMSVEAGEESARISLPPRNEPDFGALFASEAEPAEVAVTRRGGDTTPPPFTSQPPSDPQPRPLSIMPATFDDSMPPSAQAGAGGEEEADEFEILVDDDLLEIDEEEQA